MAYSKPDPDTYSELLVYQKLWHIQNHRHIQNHGIFWTGRILRTLSKIYDGVLWETANEFLQVIIIFAISPFHVHLVHEINMIFNAGLIFTPEVFILCKKVLEPGTLNFDMPPQSFAVILLHFWLSTFFYLRVRHNPYIIELIPLEFLVQIRCH